MGRVCGEASKKGRLAIYRKSFQNIRPTGPSKSSPHQCSSCFSRVWYFAWESWLSPISEEYVAKITPFFTAPLLRAVIFPYLNWQQSICPVNTSSLIPPSVVGYKRKTAIKRKVHRRREAVCKQTRVGPDGPRSGWLPAHCLGRCYQDLHPYVSKKVLWVIYKNWRA